MAIQEFDGLLNTSPKCLLYRHLVSTFNLQPFLSKPIPNLYKRCIIKIRLCSHNLAIEQGRYINVDRRCRYCKYCSTEIEDEMHFILLCPLYVHLRKTFIKPYYWRKPSVFKLVQLLSTTNVKELCSLGKYIYRSFQLRDFCF